MPKETRTKRNTYPRFVSFLFTHDMPAGYYHQVQGAHMVIISQTSTRYPTTEPQFFPYAPPIMEMRSLPLNRTFVLRTRRVTRENNEEDHIHITYVLDPREDKYKCSSFAFCSSKPARGEPCECRFLDLDQHCRYTTFMDRTFIPAEVLPIPECPDCAFLVKETPNSAPYVVAVRQEANKE